jgi:hypothetical protein
MTYANEYRLGRRAYHYNQEESLGFALSIVGIIVVAFGYYILATRYHIRPAQLCAPPDSLACREFPPLFPWKDAKYGQFSRFFLAKSDCGERTAGKQLAPIRPFFSEAALSLFTAKMFIVHFHPEYLVLTHVRRDSDGC